MRIAEALELANQYRRRNARLESENRELRAEVARLREVGAAVRELVNESQHLGVRQPTPTEN